MAALQAEQAVGASAFESANDAPATPFDPVPNAFRAVQVRRVKCRWLQNWEWGPALAGSFSTIINSSRSGDLADFSFNCLGSEKQICQLPVPVIANFATISSNISRKDVVLITITPPNNTHCILCPIPPAAMTSTSVPQLFSLEGQTALVTGGTRGIGQAMAIALAEAGADILLVQRDDSNQATKTKIESLGRKATIYIADLSSQSSVSSLVPQVLKDGHRIHILLNCGGIQRRHPSHLFPDDDWQAVLQVNLSTVFTLCRDVGAHMLAQEPNLPLNRRGTIINVASLLSFQGGITVPAYAASKGGVAQLTKALSNEWSSKGVTVNAIAPGYIATEMNTALIQDKERAASILARIPAGRWGTPDDFKGAVVYLGSAASAYVSGEILTVDGGWMGR